MPANVSSIFSGISAVWLRNFLFFRKSLIQTFFWTAFEPILYLFAIGFSLGRAIGNFEGVSYVQFYLPALLTTTAMMVAFFEASFGCFTKMQYQKTYSTIILTPVGAAEVVLGEILWCASKGAFGFVCVVLVAAGFGVLPLENFATTLLPALVVLFLTALMFSSIGLLVVSLAKNYDSFTYAISGFIVPMSLFSGTYFPLKDLPSWVQSVAWALPLTHSVAVVRNLVLGHAGTDDVVHVFVILTMTVVAAWLSIRRISRKLLS